MNQSFFDIDIDIVVDVETKTGKTYTHKPRRVVNNDDDDDDDDGIGRVNTQADNYRRLLAALRHGHTHNNRVERFR